MARIRYFHAHETAQYFLNRNRMCVHDRIAETIVIDTRKPPHPEEEGIVPQPEAPMH